MRLDGLVLSAGEIGMRGTPDVWIVGDHGRSLLGEDEIRVPPSL